MANLNGEDPSDVEGTYVDAYGVTRDANGNAIDNGSGGSGGSGGGNNNSASGRFVVWNPQGYTPPMYGGARQYAGLTEQITKSMEAPKVGDLYGRWQFSNTAPVPTGAPEGWGRYPGVGGSPPSPSWLTNPWNPLTNSGGSLGQTVYGPGVGGGGNTGGGGSGGGSEEPAAQFPTPLENAQRGGSHTASEATGMIVYQNGKMTVVPVPAEYRNMQIPWNYVGRNLPIGAFKSLWTNSQGTDWSKVKPQGSN